jgi:hypothetical protein
MLTEYTRWVDFSNRGPYQLDELEFEFRYNTNVELVEWIETVSHDSEIRVNPGGYLARVKFDKPDGAMHFKLRWL